MSPPTRGGTRGGVEPEAGLPSPLCWKPLRRLPRRSEARRNVALGLCSRRQARVGHCFTRLLVLCAAGLKPDRGTGLGCGRPVSGVRGAGAWGLTARGGPAATRALRLRVTLVRFGQSMGRVMPPEAWRRTVRPPEARRNARAGLAGFRAAWLTIAEEEGRRGPDVAEAVN